MTNERGRNWADALRAHATGEHTGAQPSGPGQSGRAHWRGIEEFLNDPDFRAEAEPEFPVGVDTTPFPAGMNRRTFMRLMGASAALAGLTGCLQLPDDVIVPYVRSQPEVTPGAPQHYATAMTLDGFGTGLLVESHEGRPTKIEGNPDHPASLGSAGRFEQASLLGLYDPHRARQLRVPGGAGSWTDVIERFGRAPLAGDGLHLLLEPTSSPLVATMLDRVRARYPGLHVYYHAPLAPTNVAAGARMALGSSAAGQPVLPQHDLSLADVVVALDADFLATGPCALRDARQWAGRRRPDPAAGPMSRLYVAEPSVTPTGASADDRLRVPASQVGAVLAGILAAVLGDRAPSPEAAAALARFRGVHGAWTAAVARDLLAHRGRGLVLVGERQPPAVHALGHALNAALGNVGRTVWYTASPLLPGGDLATLSDAMRAGAVQTLVVLEGNPAYTAPADQDFAAHLQRVPTTLYLGLHDNETARSAQWFVPAAHYLESWGDTRAYDGTLSLVQPLIAPLYGGRTPAEVLAVLAGDERRTPYELLRSAWAARGADGAAWNAALQRGLVPDSALPRIAVPASDLVATLAAVLPHLDALQPTTGAGREQIEVMWAEDASVYDGRFANNAWLQELPDPLTKLTWDNAALISPATAARLGLDTGDVVDLGREGAVVRIPVYVLPGHADDAATLPIGYGRQGAEALARGVGVDTYAFRTAQAPWFALATLTKPFAVPRHPLATTQTHWSLEARDSEIVRRTTVDGYRSAPAAGHRREARTLTLYQPEPQAHGPQWAMTIDLAICTGCNACAVACQAENNVPVVGKQGVLDSREMHWLRIDRYFAGDPQDPEVAFQPMLCQHCAKAPCEYVCPVYATLHSPDGLNEMVYNRCVGTRFCSNNCPYKVRRFNWFDYTDHKSATEKMAMNPRVTVRARGVMEKCTFCVQRIRRAEVDARLDGNPRWAAEVQTACQQACPTRAIVFGDQTDRTSAVAQRQAEPRSYAVLNDLGTAPRVQYLTRVTNPAPAVERA